MPLFRSKPVASSASAEKSSRCPKTPSSDLVMASILVLSSSRPMAHPMPHSRLHPIRSDLVRVAGHTILASRPLLPAILGRVVDLRPITLSTMPEISVARRTALTASRASKALQIRLHRQIRCHRCRILSAQCRATAATCQFRLTTPNRKPPRLLVDLLSRFSIPRARLRLYTLRTLRCPRMIRTPPGRLPLVTARRLPLSKGNTRLRPLIRNPTPLDNMLQAISSLVMAALRLRRQVATAIRRRPLEPRTVARMSQLR
jgi:hypothetical protein